jgi:hypothetical protein
MCKNLKKSSGAKGLNLLAVNSAQCAIMKQPAYQKLFCVLDNKINVMWNTEILLIKK